MTGLPSRGGAGTGDAREIFIDGVGWVSFADLMRVADVVRQGRNVWVAAELTELRQSSARDLDGLLAFWTSEVEPYTRQH